MKYLEFANLDAVEDKDMLSEQEERDAQNSDILYEKILSAVQQSPDRMVSSYLVPHEELWEILGYFSRDSLLEFGISLGLDLYDIQTMLYLTDKPILYVKNPNDLEWIRRVQQGRSSWDCDQAMKQEMQPLKSYQRCYTVLFLISFMIWATFLKCFCNGYFREIHDPTLFTVIIFAMFITVLGLIISFCFDHQLEKCNDCFNGENNPDER